MTHISFGAMNCCKTSRESRYQNSFFITSVWGQLFIMYLREFLSGSNVSKMAVMMLRMMHLRVF
jgi:hypothetical protein